MSRQGMSKNTGLDAVVGRSPAAQSKPAVTVAPSKAMVAVDTKPAPDAVRRKAYELYLERVAKGQPGDDRTDWLRAERELVRH